MNGSSDGTFGTASSGYPVQPDKRCRLEPAMAATLEDQSDQELSLSQGASDNEGGGGEATAHEGTISDWSAVLSDAEPGVG